jgi:hypothetical protein
VGPERAAVEEANGIVAAADEAVDVGGEEVGVVPGAGSGGYRALAEGAEVISGDRARQRPFGGELSGEGMRHDQEAAGAGEGDEAGFEIGVGRVVVEVEDGAEFFEFLGGRERTIEDAVEEVTARGEV